jgi:hypothetical protein
MLLLQILCWTSILMGLLLAVIFLASAVPFIACWLWDGRRNRLWLRMGVICVVVSVGCLLVYR